MLRTCASTFRDYAIVATRERELRDELGRLPDAVAAVPALEDDVHDVSGLATIGEHCWRIGRELGREAPDPGRPRP